MDPALGFRLRRPDPALAFRQRASILQKPRSRYFSSPARGTISWILVHIVLITTYHLFGTLLELGLNAFVFQNTICYDSHSHTVYLFGLLQAVRMHFHRCIVYGLLAGDRAKKQCENAMRVIITNHNIELIYSYSCIKKNYDSGTDICLTTCLASSTGVDVANHRCEEINVHPMFFIVMDPPDSPVRANPNEDTIG